MGLSNRQRAFIDQLFLCNFNATEAYTRVYAPKNRNVSRANAAKLLAKPSVKEEIRGRVAERSMGADEVLTRLADIARGDISDFLDIGSMGFVVDLEKAKEDDLTRLVKKVRQRTTITRNNDSETENHQLELELYDAQAALNTLAKIHGLLVDKTELSGSVATQATEVHFYLPDNGRGDGTA